MTPTRPPGDLTDAGWAEWLASFPSLQDSGDPSELLSRLRAHIDAAPDPQTLSPHDRRIISEDLLAYAGEVQSVMASASDIGLLNLFVAMAGVAAAIAIPTATVTISLIPVAAACYVLIMGIAQRRREAIAMEIVEVMRSTRRAIRR